MTDNLVPPPHAPESGDSPASNIGSPELEQNDYSQYLLYSRSEILFVLRSVIQKGCLLTVYFDGGRQFFLTALLAISEDGEWLYFDPGSDEKINQSALSANKLLFTTMLDKVKIQFSLTGLQSARAGGNRTAFAGRLPESVLRLQRREYYRLTTPIANPVKCALSIAGPEGVPTVLDANVLDISGGGVGLQIPNELASQMENGTVFHDCRITLPDEGLLTTSLCVRNSFNVTTKAGQSYLRVGCEYVNLPGTRLTMIQRYITKVERERKARAAGDE